MADPNKVYPLDISEFAPAFALNPRPAPKTKTVWDVTLTVAAGDEALAVAKAHLDSGRACTITPRQVPAD